MQYNDELEQLISAVEDAIMQRIATSRSDNETLRMAGRLQYENVMQDVQEFVRKWEF